MIVHLIGIAAKAMVLKTKTADSFNNLLTNTGLEKERFSVSFDSSLGDDEFIVQEDKFVLNAKSAEEVQSFVEIVDNFEEVPKEINEIVKTVSVLNEDPIRDLKSGAYNFMIFFTDKSEHIVKLKGLDSVGGVKFFVSSDESLAKSMNVSFPSVLVYNSKDKNLFTLPFTESVSGLISAATLSSFTKIDQESFKLLQSLEQPIFYVIDHKGNYQNIKKELGAEMKVLSYKLKFVFFAPQEIPALIQLMNVEDSDYPMLINLGKDGKFAIKNINKDNFMTSVHKIINKEVPPVKFVAKLPADNESRPVKILNTETIKDTINNTNVDRLIVFTSPRCGYCTSLKPILDKFSTILKEKNIQLLIGDYSVIENEEVSGYDTQAVPALFLLTKGSSSSKKLPNECRSIKTLLEYISNEGVSSKIDLANFKEHLIEEENEDESSIADKEELVKEEKIEHNKAREEL